MNLHIHSLVGERWDGRRDLRISEHSDARLKATPPAPGEIRDTSQGDSLYTYNPTRLIVVQLAKSDYAQKLFLWGHEETGWRCGWHPR